MSRLCLVHFSSELVITLLFVPVKFLSLTHAHNNVNVPSFLVTLLNVSIFFFLKMALSAGTPILRGYLSDLDCRWCVIAGAVDDRTPEERGLEVSHALSCVNKSRNVQ